MSLYAAPMSAIYAFGVDMQVTTNNIANMNTDGFQASRLDLETGPLEQGVRLGAIIKDTSPGPAVVSHITEREARTAIDQTTEGMRDAAEAYNSSRVYESGLQDKAEAAAAGNARERRHFVEEPNRFYAEGSNTSLPLEFANLAYTQTAYSANAAVIRTLDTMTGSLLNAIA